MARYDIRLAEPAEDDLTDILRYIAVELKEPSAALRLLETIDQAIESLAVMPHRCPPVDDDYLAEIGYRKLHIKNDLAFFSIDEETNTVNVERILYAKRDWLHIL